MRAWLENNLMLNLEKEFRCMSPSRLFPNWLRDAKLRGSGSGITEVKFRAIPNACQLDGNCNTTSLTGGEEKRVDVELRSIVGRMLWQEVWGNFVQGDAWWWQDPNCVKECLKLNTHHILQK